MAVFLSEEWIAGVEAAVREVAALATMPGVVMEQRVHDVPRRGEVQYRLVLGAASEHPPVVRVTMDYATATALSEGRTNAQTALAAGRLRLGGAVDALVTRADAFGVLDDVLATVRAATTYP